MRSTLILFGLAATFSTVLAGEHMPINATTTAVPTMTPSLCDAARATCDKTPGANHAVCAAEYAKCMAGCTATVNPVPTPVPSTTSDCQVRRDACDKAPDANHAVCAAEYATCIKGCTGVAPAPTAAPGCGDCSALRATCDTVPNANHALCAAEFANCQMGNCATRNPVPTPGPTTTAPYALFTGAASAHNAGGLLLAAGLAAAML